MMCVTQMSLSALLHLLGFEMNNKEYITDFDQLYGSMMKCKKVLVGNLLLNHLS